MKFEYSELMIIEDALNELFGGEMAMEYYRDNYTTDTGHPVTNEYLINIITKIERMMEAH